MESSRKTSHRAKLRGDKDEARAEETGQGPRMAISEAKKKIRMDNAIRDRNNGLALALNVFTTMTVPDTCLPKHAIDAGSTLSLCTPASARRLNYPHTRARSMPGPANRSPDGDHLVTLRMRSMRSTVSRRITCSLVFCMASRAARAA